LEPYAYFSNAPSPVQIAVALTTLRIIISEERATLRKKVMANSIYLREQLKGLGYKVTGIPSPIVPLIVGDEIKSRLLARYMLNYGVIVNSIGPPAVA